MTTSRYELWDTETGNAIGAYATEGEAVRALRRAFSRYGPDCLRNLSLIEIGRFGPSATVATGLSEMTRLIERGGTVLAR